jgi:hypothetical protein
MKTMKWMIVLAAAMLLVAPASAYDDEDYKPPEDKDEVTATMGATPTSTDGALFRVAEYDATEGDAILGLSWMTSPYGRNLFSLDLQRLESADFDASFSLDLNRVVRVSASGNGLLHRLGHDSLSNLEAVSDLKVVRHTDLEPGAEYQIKHKVYAVQAAFHPPVASWLSYRVGFREEQRDGNRQVLAASHCTSCHVTSQGRRIDNSTSDFTFGVHAKSGGMDLDYELLTRDFRENGATPMGTYEQAFRPATPPSAPDPDSVVTPFNDRLWFQNGQYPVNQVPEIRRTAHKLKARGQINRNNSVNFTLVQSTTENRTSNLEYDFSGFRGRYTAKFKNNMRFNLWGQWDKIENDPYFVDLLALNGLTSPPISDGGPGYTGITYEQYINNVLLPTRPGAPESVYFSDYDRAAAQDREESRLGADLSWRANRRNNVRLGYKYRSIDRDYVVLNDGTGKTTSHTLKASWNYRAAKRVRWNNTLRYTTIDNPYVNVNGGLRAYSEDPPGIAPSPKSPLSLQYFELQALRVANLSSVPTDELRFRSQATWSPKGNWALSGNVRYRDAENDELDWTQWERNTTGFGANLWYAAGPEFQFTLGVDSQKQETDAVAIVPVMDG